MEMMKKLFKHPLDFEILYPYFKNRLEGVNALSNELINLVNFKDGIFFTLLPDDANLDRIYELKAGLVLPQFPQMLNEKGKGKFQYIPTIEEEISEYIYNKLCSDNMLTCVIDDYNSSPDSKFSEYFKLNGLLLFYNNEVYYKLRIPQTNSNIIEECLGYSNTFWHSLCLLTKADFNIINETLNLEEIKEICLKAHLIMVDAYDAEGYVMWEKE